jgi:hypothetical protein
MTLLYFPMLDAVLAADRDGGLNAAALVPARGGWRPPRPGVNHLNFLHLSRQPASQ